MAFRALTQTHIYEKQAAQKEKDKSSIQCLECYAKNVYIGTKNAIVQHLILSQSINGDLSPDPCKTREGRTRKLGTSSHIARLRAVPLFNHLLVLWDRSVTALNMFSLESIPGLNKIQQVSLFEVCDSPLAAPTACVQMVTSSSRRKVIQIHIVGVDRWEVVKVVPLLQEPVALAVDGTSVCLATMDRYLLCDSQTGCSEELFPHNHSRQHVIVASVGQGEFLLNGPESLGMFVMKTGICQRPPLQWPQGVLGAAVCFPYILTLQPQMLSVYSMVDQQHKQTVSLSGAKDGVLVFTESNIFSLQMVPLQEQIQTLVRHERIEEALLLLEGVQSRDPLDSRVTTKGELDPREIIRLYPDIEACLTDDFQSRFVQVNKGTDLQVLRQQDKKAFHHHLCFLGDFLRGVRGTQQGLGCIKELDCALLRLYVELGDFESLQQLVASPNECKLDHCVPVLEQNNRSHNKKKKKKSYLLEAELYHGNQIEAIQTWVQIVDGAHQDSSCSDVYGHIVWTLSQLQDRDAVRTFADWTLQRNQEQRADSIYGNPNSMTSPLCMVCRSVLVIGELWLNSKSCFVPITDRVKSTTLHTEKAILLGRTGEYGEALKVLVHQVRDPEAAEAFCCRASQGQDSQFRQSLLLTLLQIYLSSEALISTAVDLLNNYSRVIAAEKVIQILPDSWSVELISQFLFGSLRETLHQRRMAKLQKFRLDKGQKCTVCQRDLAEPQFARTLHGELMHTSCTSFSSS
uniref:CNH domain-containing protein n=1 Tax=Mola mola TaxID=94237 RepID=A0A3Q4B3Q5_MOLML